MTIAELREILFFINDQEMTIRELRKLLFDVEDQDTELIVEFIMWQKLGVE